MYLDAVVKAQKEGMSKGIVSVCTAHPTVLQQYLNGIAALNSKRDGAEVRPLLEATCNQVNQYGGYTGMPPQKFIEYVKEIAFTVDFPFDLILFGGDHLGPSPWQGEDADSAMAKAEILIRDYVRAGFTKIHLDCSMKLADDPEEPLDIEISAKRTAQLAKIAEKSGNGEIRYVIGTEVPVPGGAAGNEVHLVVTKPDDVKKTLDITRQAFTNEGLETVWEKVIAVVVQPGVEFGDDFIHPYKPEAALDLVRFIEQQPIVYEAHSTDYQTRQALKNLVRDHFAILKVGPGLTYTFREGIFELAEIEDRLFSPVERSNIIEIIDEVMVENPKYWKAYYSGASEEMLNKRKYSYSDRIRYYWNHPIVKQSLERLMKNLEAHPDTDKQIKKLTPNENASNEMKHDFHGPWGYVQQKIQILLDDYIAASGI